MATNKIVYDYAKPIIRFLKETNLRHYLELTKKINSNTNLSKSKYPLFVAFQLEMDSIEYTISEDKYNKWFFSSFNIKVENDGYKYIDILDNFIVYEVILFIRIFHKYICYRDMNELSKFILCFKDFLEYHKTK